MPMPLHVTLFVLTILLATPAHAWNALGHKTVAEIAWRQLEPSDRERIVEVLRRHPRFDADFAGKMTDDVLAADKATQDHWIFQHAATWPDIARGLPKGERGKYDRPVWHYVNFPLFVDATDRRAIAQNVSTEYPTTTETKDYNILQAIAHCRAALRSQAGADVKATAYCWLMHLVGDIHQPLHSTALFSVNQFPEGDRGGNSILLVRGSNLHSLWDNLLGRQYYMRNVEQEVAELSRGHREVWDSAANETNPLKWADEGHKLCESFVYADEILKAVRETPVGGKLTPIELPDDYYKLAGEHARRRIIAAGLRLASVLDQRRP